MAVITSAHITLSRVDDGVSIKTIDVLYKKSNSNSVAPQAPSSSSLNGWLTQTPAWENGSYIWSVTETVLSNGSKKYSNPVCITGEKGSTGITGQGVESITEEYYLSTSKTKQVGGKWEATPQPWSMGKYIWTRSKIVYKNPTVTKYTTPICSSEWEAIDDVEIGGRNLILNSQGTEKEGFYKNFTKVENGYGECTISSKHQYNGINIADGYLFNCREYIINKPLSFSFDIMYTQWNFPEGTDRKEFWIGQRYTNSLTNPNAEGRWRSVIRCNLPEVGVDNCKLNEWFHVECHGIVPSHPDPDVREEAYIKLYNSNPNVTATVTMRIKNVKLEYGHKATDWTPAPEDVQNSISKIDQKADKISLIVKSGTSESNLVLTDGAINATANQINLKGLVKFEGLNSSLQSQINKPQNTIDSWAKAPEYGKDNTTINGGYIQTNTINVEQINVENLFAKNSVFSQKLDAHEINADLISAGTVKAKNLDLRGINVRKQTLSGNEISTFSVSNDGDVNIRGSVESFNYKNGVDGWSIKEDGSAEFNDVVVRGSLITNDSGLVNDKNLLNKAITEEDKKIRFWAGASFENRSQAPFIVYNDGTFKSSMGSYDGVCTGKVEIGNVIIADPNSNAGNDASIVIKDGNTGIKKVQLTDKSESMFTQSLIIANSFYETQVSINSDQSSYFKHGIHLNKDTYFRDDKLVIKNSSVSDFEGTMLLESDAVQIGKVNKYSDLKIYGNVDIQKDINIKGTIYFGDNVIFKKVKNGLNIDII